MANDKKNINELVSEEDDLTADLKALGLQRVRAGAEDDLSESSARTYDFIDADDDRSSSISVLQHDLQARSETINHLQYDIEQLRARWIGLETEIKAREEITDSLNSNLHEAREELRRKDKLIKKRDQLIKALKAEIRDRNIEYDELKASVDEHEQSVEGLQSDGQADRTVDSDGAQMLLEQQAGQIASAEILIKEQRAQIDRTEAYADTLRRQLNDRTTSIEEADGTRTFLESSVARATCQLEELQAVLEEERNTNAELRKSLDELEAAHAEEIRMVRFELGEAQDTVAQHELLTEQLASDLVDTRGFRDEFERMLTKTEEDNKAHVEQLEKDNRRLLREAAEINEKLDTKSDAINCLLAELAKKSQQIDSIGEIEEVIHEIDDRMSERIDEHPGKERDRLTRVLIGSVDGQELRFPLFKDRLTIGRTEQNDIQLEASYVSRRHAVVVTERDATRIVDWGSRNGVFVNSKRVTEHFLRNGDTVTIGTADFRYEERPKRDA